MMGKEFQPGLETIFLNTHYDELFDSIPESVICIEEDGRINFCNLAAVELSGYRKDQLLQKNIFKLLLGVGNDDINQKPKFNASLLAAFKPKPQDMYFICQSGRRIHIEISFRKQFPASASDSSYVLFLKDVSEKNNNRKMLKAIISAQHALSFSENHNEIFDDILSELLSLTQSEYGFIGDVYLDDSKQPYLKTRAITNISWNDETRNLYDKNIQSGLEFRNTKTLFGKVLTSGEHIIANSPSKHPAHPGVPKGHPPLECFMGIPLYSNSEMIGMAGIANRPGGYNESLIEFLQPFLQTCSNLIKTIQTEGEKSIQNAKLKENEARGRAILENALEAIITIDSKGSIEDVNPATVRIFGYEPEELKGRNVCMLMPEPYRSEHDNYLLRYLKTGIAKVIGKGREVTGQRKNKQTFPMELSISHITVGGRDMFTGVIRDITEQKNNALELERLNTDLSIRLHQLDAINSHNLLLNQMNMFFQTCENLDEIADTIHEFCPKIFPETSGALYFKFCASHFEKLCSWGDHQNNEEINIKDCWSLRQRSRKLFDAKNPLLCNHLKDTAPTHSICMPVTTNEGTIALFVLYGFDKATGDNPVIQKNLEALISDISERFATAITNIRLQEKLHNESIRDPLSSLFNRRFFDQSYELAFRRYKRTNAPFSLISIDIDNFKEVNDNYGHEIGDDVIKTIANILLENTRESDVCCRLGGEEFLILLNDCNGPDAEHKSEEIRLLTEQIDTILAKQKLPKITISCGVISIPEDCIEKEHCLNEADKSLYLAKQNGRNCSFRKDKKIIQQPTKGSSK